MGDEETVLEYNSNSNELLEASVPKVPSMNMMYLIRRARKGDFPEDWKEGKRLQREERGDGIVPYKTEYEISAGYYFNHIRPKILELVSEMLDVDSLKEWEKRYAK